MHKSYCISSEIVTRTVADSQWLILWQKCANEFFAYSILEKKFFSHQHSIKSICMLWLEYSSSIFWNKKVHCAFCLVIFPKFLGSMSIMSWRSVAFVVIVESISWFGVDRHEMVPNDLLFTFSVWREISQSITRIYLSRRKRPLPRHYHSCRCTMYNFHDSSDIFGKSHHFCRLCTHNAPWISSKNRHFGYYLKRLRISRVCGFNE